MSSVSEYNAYMNSRQRMQESFDAERAQSQENHEKVIEDLKEDYNDDAARVKQAYQEQLENEKESAREEVRRLKDELYDAKGQRITKESIERNREQQNLLQYKADIEKEAQRQIQRSEDYSNHRAVERAKREDEKIEAALNSQKRSHVEEVRSLKDEIDLHRSLDRDVSSERAKAKTDVIAEYEGEHLQEKRRLADSYNTQIDKLHRDKDEMKDYFGRELTAASFETNAKAQNLLREQKKQFSKAENDLIDQHRQVEKELSEQLQREKQRGVQNMGKVIAIENDRKDHALQAKDQTYQEYLAQKELSTRTELNQKDQRIKMLETTDDPQKVSPAVVAKIHNQERELNFKELNAFKESQNKQRDALAKRNQEDRRALKNQFDQNVSEISRKAQMDNDRTVRDLNVAFTDLNERHGDELSDVKEKNRQTVERMKLQSSVAMTQLQRRDMEALQDQRSQLNQQMDSVREEAEFQRKAQDREWFMKFSTARRDFERKLTEMQDQHESLTQEMKLEYDKKLRDQDRNWKQVLEDRVRQYEHLIKQQELSFREKERFLKEQSQEELDKMRRANAHLIQKKS